ncbi:MAG: glycosyltransferase [Rhodocyclales bacterium]|nr:glycosyltransferase [Rhodocyclales bacterium]
MLNLVNHLAQQGRAVSVTAFTQGGPLWDRLDPRARVTNLATTSLRRSLLPLLAEVRRVRPRVVFSTLGYVNLAVLALRLFFPRNTRVWIREANLPSISLANNRAPRMMRLGYRRLYPRADLLICSSQRMADELTRDFAVPPAAIRILPNPVDEAEIRRLAATRPNRETGGRLFVAAGRLTHQKGFDRLLRLMAEMPDADSRLTILGDGPQRDELVGLARDLGMTGRVMFEGFVKNPWGHFAIADALLLPSRWEGMPNAVLEALAVGTPVIATPESGGIAELAAKSVPAAVTVAGFGAPFAAAMAAVRPKPEGPLVASLLPAEFGIESVAATFDSWLAEHA